MELLYTARIIKQIEVDKKMSFMTALEDFSLSTLTVFVQRGLALNTEEEAYDAIAKYFTDENGDILSLYILIVESLQKTGFLPRQIPIAEMKENIQKSMESIVKKS